MKYEVWLHHDESDTHTKVAEFSEFKIADAYILEQDHGCETGLVHYEIKEVEGDAPHRWDQALEFYPNIKKFGLSICDYNCTWYVSADRLEALLKEKFGVGD